jgi:cellulose binding protein with CBM2 domain
MVAVVLVAMLTAGTVLAGNRTGAAAQSAAASERTTTPTGHTSAQASTQAYNSGVNPAPAPTTTGDGAAPAGPTGHPSASATVTGSATPQASGSCLRVTHAVNSQWSEGFQTQFTVVNCGNATINGWMVAVSFTDRVELQVWNAQPDGGAPTVRFSPLGFDNVIAPGKNVTFGFNATWSSGAARTITGCAVAAGSCS